VPKLVRSYSNEQDIITNILQQNATIKTKLNQLADVPGARKPVCEHRNQILVKYFKLISVLICRKDEWDVVVDLDVVVVQEEEIKDKKHVQVVEFVLASKVVKRPSTNAFENLVSKMPGLSSSWGSDFSLSLSL
jgi:hypothetical protein